MKKILIVAGEPSGDLHASNLVKDLKSLKPDIEFFGLGGDLLKKAGVDISFDIKKLAVVALVDVWKNIFTIGKIFKGLLKKIDAEKPRLAILVDYPGFNLRLAKKLKKRGIPVVYYISPQIWAWAPERIEIIKRCVTKMIVFFKFEEELYRRHGVNVEFIGHPLLDTVKPILEKNTVVKKYGLYDSKPVIALLPGSRLTEVKALLDIMIEASVIIDHKLGGAQVIVVKYRDLPSKIYEDAIANVPLNIKISFGDGYNILSVSDFAIVASGTATLETAIIGTPFVITYRTNFINYIAYKIVAKINVLGLPNIIAGKTIVPELLQCNATAERIANASFAIMADPIKKSTMAAELKKVRDSLGSPGARLRAAQAILPYL